MINEFAHTPKEWNYLRGYIGLRSNGVVKNFVHVSPKPTKKFIHINFLTDDASDWRERFSEAGAVVAGKKKTIPRDRHAAGIQRAMQFDSPSH